MQFKKKLVEFFLPFSAVSLFFLIQDNIFECNRSEGDSMLPTIPNQSTLLIDKFFFKIRGLQKGDIVICKSPVKSEIDVCKRITFLENECKIYLLDTHGIRIPKNHIWIEGDNPDQSFDSRQHGPLAVNLVKGRILYSIYPFNQLKDRVRC